MSLLKPYHWKGLVRQLFKISTALGLLLLASLFSACTQDATNVNSTGPATQTTNSTGATKTQSASTSPTTPSSSPSKNSENYLTAAPNPVPAGSGAGTTKISWRTTYSPSDQVHVYAVGLDGKEALFATGSEGSQAAPWITADAPVEFRLYGGTDANKKLIDKITVSRNK